MSEQPVQTTAPIKTQEPVIYTIPEQFYGLAARANLPKEGSPPVSAVAGPAPHPQTAQSRKWLLIPVFALLLLVGLGFIAWRFLLPKTTPVPPAPSVTLPAPQPEAPPSAPGSVPEPASATTTTETPPTPGPEADNDADGLTNAEEALYGTSPSIADSDSDGYSDALEVTNLYNPAGFKPTKLVEAGLVKTFSPADGQWQILIPTQWTQLPGQTAFVSNQGQEVLSVQVQDNPGGKSASDFYLSGHSQLAGLPIQTFMTKSGLEGVLAQDGLSADIPLGGKMYVIAIGPQLQANPTYKTLFSTTFTMVLNSFGAKP